MTDTIRRFSCLALAGMIAAAAAGCGSPPPPRTCAGRVPGDLVITEIMYNPAGTDTGKEYIEFYNASGAPIDLKNIAIFNADSAGAAEKVHLFAEGTVEPGGYYVVGDVRETTLPAHINQSYGTGLGALRNTGGTVGLRCGAVELDKVVYAIGDPGPKGADGRAMILDGVVTPPNAASNDDMARWCDARTEHVVGSGLYGSPGRPNEHCVAAPTGDHCKDTTTNIDRLIVKPKAGELVISELHVRPAAVSSTNGEFIELYATADVDLNGLEILRENTAAGPWALTPTAPTSAPPPCMRVAATQYRVIARNKEPTQNGQLPVDKVIATAPIGLIDAGATIILRHGTTEIDRAPYTSGQFPTSGASIQVKGVPDAARNDVAANWCTSANAWATGADRGTPGLPSDCPP